MDTSAEELYDEFGNYIGPALAEEDEDDYDEYAEEDDLVRRRDAEDIRNGDDTALSLVSPQQQAHSAAKASSDAIVPYEQKQYYPDASEVYGDAEVVVGMTDAQSIDVPIIAPLKRTKYAHTEQSLPNTTFDYAYLTALMDVPELIRHVSIIGHLHSGKTSLCDAIVTSTHPDIAAKKKGEALRYTDARFDEQARGLSIKSSPLTVLLPSLNSKSYVISLIDTPGHLNFVDERTAAMRLTDGVIVVVDCAEGVLVGTEQSIVQAVRDGQTITLLLNKLDRLILDLHIPPQDAYHKLVHIIENCNDIASQAGYTQRLSPENNNVCFGSALHQYFFTLQSFAKIYCDRQLQYQRKQKPSNITINNNNQTLSSSSSVFNYKTFAKHLWGNTYLHNKSRRFHSQAENNTQQRTFIQFILEPIYKIYSLVISLEYNELYNNLYTLGINITATEALLETSDLLSLVMSRFFQNNSINSLTEMLISIIPNPIEAAKSKIKQIYTGSLINNIGLNMINCNNTNNALLMIHITKLYTRDDGKTFDAFGRIFSGIIHKHDNVRILGEQYIISHGEDIIERTVTKLFIFNTRYKVEVDYVKAGNFVLIEGVDATILKTATITNVITNNNNNNNNIGEIGIFRPLLFPTISALKIPIEPFIPSELPKMLEGLRRLDKTYPLCTSLAEKSGEHVLFGVGELYTDCLLYDLRQVFAQIEIRVSDPIVKLNETVTVTSSLRCLAQTPNKANTFTVISQPISTDLATAIENGSMSALSSKERENVLMERYGFDVLAARNVWAFGPDSDTGPNILLDDTLPGEVSTTNNIFIQGLIAECVDRMMSKLTVFH